MSKNKIEILALIDRSGSMSNIMDSTVSAFNEFIAEQRSQNFGDKVKVTLASFDSEYEVVFDRIPLEEVPELTVSMVQPRGMTALHDSIGKLITGAKHQDRDTIVLIQTDGWDNQSKEFTPELIKKLVETKESQGWDFNFIGAGLGEQQTTQMSGQYGVSKAFAVASSSSGMESFKSTISASTTAYRSLKS